MKNPQKVMLFSLRSAGLPHKAEFFPDAEEDCPIYRESRGIRTFSLGADDGSDFMTRARQMGTVAACLLKHVGEFTPKDVCARLSAEQQNDGQAVRKALLTWCAQIIARHGALSPIAIAAKYLGLQHVTVDALVDEAIDPCEKMRQVFALCDAWHWLHMEVYGEHRRTFDGLRNEENLRSAGRHRTDQKQERKRVISEWCEEYWRRRQADSTKVARTARAVLRDVNAKLKGNGQTVYKSAESLEPVIREIIRERGQARN